LSFSGSSLVAVAEVGRLAEISLPDSADCVIEPFGDNGRRERRRAR